MQPVQVKLETHILVYSSSQINPQEDIQLRALPPHFQQIVIENETRHGLMAAQVLSEDLVVEMMQASLAVAIATVLDHLVIPEDEGLERGRQAGAVGSPELHVEIAHLEVADERHVLGGDAVLEHVQEHLLFEDHAAELVEGGEVFGPEAAAGEEDLPGGAGGVVVGGAGFAAPEGEAQASEEVLVDVCAEFRGEALEVACYCHGGGDDDVRGGSHRD